MSLDSICPHANPCSAIPALARRWHTIAALLALALVAPPAAAGQHPGERPRDLLESWAGDFDGMMERNRIRVLVTHSKTFYFLDRATQRGTTYELLKTFEKSVNEQLGKGTMRVHVLFIPVNRDELISGLVEGLGDLAVANLTITPERSALVDFSVPTLRDVSEVVVTGPRSPEIRSVEDLAGQTIHVRESSSYHASLTALNERFRAEGRPEIRLTAAEEVLEDEDLLEMVNAGLLPMAVVDRHKAEFWTEVLDDIVVHADVAVRTGGDIGWAMRKDSPQLRAVVDEFVRKNRKGTLLGNMLFNRYLKSTKYVQSALSEDEVAKFRMTIEFFRKYAGEYGFDWRITAALGYQESQLDQSVRSKAGAVGVMQVLPSTAQDPNVAIPDIHQLESNIHAGVKYLHFLHHRYFLGSEMDTLNQWLFTFAAYNAGPAKVRRLRAQAEEMGLDPNRWFRNVELVAAKRIGHETVQYVSNIYKYYIAFKLLVAAEADKQAARAGVQ